jgi:hypothetical protein
MAAILAALIVGGEPAGAQISAEQQSALRANCRGDFMSKCAGVTPGGKAALECLQTNVASLSPGCKAAVSATLPKAEPAPPKAEVAKPEAPKAEGPKPPQAPDAAPPAPAAAAPVAAPPAATVAQPEPPKPVDALPAPTAPRPAPVKPAAGKPPTRTATPAAAAPTAAQQNAIKAACRSDFMSHCSGVAPGGKDALMCLQRNVAALSPSCKDAVSVTMHGSAAAAPPAGAAPAAAPPATAPGPTPDQLKAIKFTCRRDFARDCRGVPPGGPEALACLQRNMPRLSQNCRTSMAAIADEVPPAGAMPGSPPAAAAAPAAEPNPVDAAVMLRACKRDLMRHCRDVPVGEGRKLACLNAHRDELSMRCQGLMKATAPLR